MAATPKIIAMRDACPGDAAGPSALPSGSRLNGNPSLSIVIPSARRTDLLRPCLEAVLTHAPSGSEVIVVDDGSPDAVVSQVAHQQGVMALRLARQGGFCAAANAGIGAAKGAIVELLNDDTLVEPGWASAALAAFTTTEVAAVAPLVLDGTGQRIDSAGQRYYLGGVAGKRGHGQAISPEFLQPCRVFGACASSAFYRREVLLAVGGFPASFGAYFDDVELSFRLNRAGYQIRFEPSSRVRHCGGASHPFSRRLAEQQSLNEERVFWRNLPAAALGRAGWRHAAVLAGKAYRRWQEGTLLPFVCGRLRVLGEVGAIRAHRRELPPIGAARVPESWLVESRFWE